MSEWKEYRLADHCMKIGSGATPRGGSNTYMNKGKYALIRSQNVLDFNFSYNGLAYISEEQAKKLNNVLVEEEDILLNITGDSVARVTQIPKELIPARVNQHVAIIRPNPKRLNPQFVKYFLLNPNFKEYMLMLSSSGATRKAITKGMIEDFIIIAPVIEEQTAIAEILSSLDDKIELNNEINKNLEDLAQALFKHWFVDFEFPDENGQPYKSSGGELVESVIGLIPNGWKIVKNSDACEISDFVANGSFASLKQNVTILDEPSYALFLRNTDAKSNFTNQLRHVDEKTYKFLAKSKLFGDEICISNVADVGFVFRPPVYLNIPMTLGNNLVLLRSDTPNYFYLYFKFIHAVLVKLQHGLSQGTWLMVQPNWKV
jgi:restriction endonuclease S subunit